MTDGDHWLDLTPEQRVMLKPWLLAWTVALVVQIAAAVVIPICLSCMSSQRAAYLLVPVLLGYAGQRLIFAICKIRVDQMMGEPQNWRLLVNSLSLALIAMAACGYSCFSLTDI